MHQADPVRTLTQIAGLLRPGGWIVAHEPLATPPPRSHPQLGALGTYWGLVQEVMERAGFFAPPGPGAGLRDPREHPGGSERARHRGWRGNLLAALAFVIRGY
jgi:hypothetical protein